VVEHGGYNISNADVVAERVFTAPCSSRSEYQVRGFGGGVMGGVRGV